MLSTCGPPSHKCLQSPKNCKLSWEPFQDCARRAHCTLPGIWYTDYHATRAHATPFGWVRVGQHTLLAAWCSWLGQHDGRAMRALLFLCPAARSAWRPPSRATGQQALAPELLMARGVRQGSWAQAAGHSRQHAGAARKGQEGVQTRAYVCGPKTRTPQAPRETQCGAASMKS